MNSSNEIYEFPFDVWKEILSYLPFEQNGWFNFMLTCKQFRAFALRILGPFEDSYLLRYACEKKLPNLAKELLENERVDPSARSFEAIVNAENNGFTNLVDTMLDVKSLDKTKMNNLLFRTVCERNLIRVAKKLLQDSKIDPSDVENYALRVAAKKGFPDMVELLLGDKRVDPNAFHGQSVYDAACNGHLLIVKAIMKHPKFDANTLTLALRDAFYGKHPEIVAMIASDPRFKIDESLDLLELIETNTSHVIRDALLEHKKLHADIKKKHIARLKVPESKPSSSSKNKKK